MRVATTQEPLPAGGAGPGGGGRAVAAGALAASILLLTACGSNPAAQREEPAGVQHLPDGPRVSLERVIATRSDIGRGRFLRRLTGQPDVPLFRRPYGVAWDGDDLLVTDPGAGRVVRLGPQGRLVTSPEELFRSTIGVAVCATGVVVSDSQTGRIALLDRDLRLVRWIAKDLSRPTGLACEGERVFVVETGRHRVLAIEPTGWIAPTASAGGRAMTSGELVFVPAPDGESVLILQPDRVTRILGGRGKGPGRFNYPTAIANGPRTLWVGDTLNFRLQRFDPVTGAFVGAFGRLGDLAGEMPRLKDLDVDSSGRVWVSDGYLDNVALYRPDGRFLMSLGNSGSAPGEFSFPAGIAVHPDGRVAVVDSLNRRLQVFRVAMPDPAPPS